MMIQAEVMRAAGTGLEYVISPKTTGQRASTGLGGRGRGWRLCLAMSGTLITPATWEAGRGDLVGYEARREGLADLGQLLIIIYKIVLYSSFRESFKY